MKKLKYVVFALFLLAVFVGGCAFCGLQTAHQHR